MSQFWNEQIERNQKIDWNMSELNKKQIDGNERIERNEKKYQNNMKELNEKTNWPK